MNLDEWFLGAELAEEDRLRLIRAGAAPPFAGFETFERPDVMHEWITDVLPKE